MKYSGAPVHGGTTQDPRGKSARVKHRDDPAVVLDWNIFAGAPNHEVKVAVLRFTETGEVLTYTVDQVEVDYDS